MADTQPTNLDGIERGWRKLMLVIGKKSPKNVTVGTGVLKVLDRRMGRR